MDLAGDQGSSTRLHPPPGFDELSDEQLAANKLRRANADAEEKARLKDGNVGYLGARKVKALPRTSVPKTVRKKYSLIPLRHREVKARDAATTKEAKKALKWWLEAYADAHKQDNNKIITDRG